MSLIAPTVSQSGIGLGMDFVFFTKPHNEIVRATSIGGGEYITASVISPFKHSIASATLNFNYNNFVDQFREKAKKIKKKGS